MGDIEVGHSIRLEGKFDQLERAIVSVSQAVEKVEAQTKSLNETSEATKKAAEGMWDLDRLEAYQGALSTLVDRYTDITKQLMELAIAGDKEVAVGRQFEEAWKGSSIGLAESVSQLSNYRLGLTESQQLLIRMSALHMDQYQAMELVAATSRIAAGLGVDQVAAQEAVLRSMETGEMRGLNLLHLSKEQKDAVKSTADLYELLVAESQKYADHTASAGQAAAHLQVELANAEDNLATAVTDSERMRMSFEGMATMAAAVSEHMDLVVAGLTSADFSGLGGLLQAASELIGRLWGKTGGGLGEGAGIGPTAGMTTQEFLKYQMSLIPGGSGSDALNKGGFGAGGGAADTGIVEFSEADAYGEIIMGSTKAASKGATRQAPWAGMAGGQFGAAYSPSMGLGVLGGSSGGMLSQGVFAGSSGGGLMGPQLGGSQLGLAGLEADSDVFRAMEDSALSLAETLEATLEPAMKKLLERQKDIQDMGESADKAFSKLGKTISHDLAGALMSAVQGEMSLGEALAHAAETRGAQIATDSAAEALWYAALAIGKVAEQDYAGAAAAALAAAKFTALAAGGGIMMAIGGAAGDSGGSTANPRPDRSGSGMTTANFIETNTRASPGGGAATVNNFYVEGNAIGDLSAFGVMTAQAQQDAAAKGLL